MLLLAISVLLRQPKILSKVIPRFESKQGAGRPFLRWTTRKSQVQYFEKTGRVLLGGKMHAIHGLLTWNSLPVRSCFRAACKLVVCVIFLPGLLGRYTEFECLE